MKYAIINDQNEVLLYPVTLEALVSMGRLNSTEYTPAELVSAGVVEVEVGAGKSPMDEYNKDIQPVLQSNGTWKEEWVRIATTDEQKLQATNKFTQSVLNARNKFLDISDWTQMPDVTLANKAAWATYRQALRDITAQAGYPWNVEWPERPE